MSLNVAIYIIPTYTEKTEALLLVKVVQASEIFPEGPAQELSPGKMVNQRGETKVS